MIAFGWLRNNGQEEETEAERAEKLNIQKRAKLAEELEKEFQLEIFRRQVQKQSYLKKEVFEEGGHQEKAENEDAKIEAHKKEMGFKEILDDFQSYNLSRQSLIRRYEAFLAGEEFPTDPMLTKISEIEEELKELIVKSSHAEQENEQVIAKYHCIQNDKLVLMHNIDKMRQTIKFVDNLELKQNGLNDPKHKEVNIAVRHARADLKVEKVSKEIIIGELKGKYNRAHRERKELVN